MTEHKDVFKPKDDNPHKGLAVLAEKGRVEETYLASDIEIPLSEAR